MHVVFDDKHVLNLMCVRACICLPQIKLICIYFQKTLKYFSLRVRLFCMALVEQLGLDSWSVVCAACCHMALVFAIMHLYKFNFNFILRLSIPFLYFSLTWYR